MSLSHFCLRAGVLASFRGAKGRHVRRVLRIREEVWRREYGGVPYEETVTVVDWELAFGRVPAAKNRTLLAKSFRSGADYLVKVLTPGARVRGWRLLPVGAIVQVQTDQGYYAVSRVDPYSSRSEHVLEVNGTRMLEPSGEECRLLVDTSNPEVFLADVVSFTHNAGWLDWSDCPEALVGEPQGGVW